MCSQSAGKLHCQTSLHLSSQSWAILGEGPSISHPLGSRRSSSAPFDVARLYESHPQENLWDICLYYITTSVRGSDIGMIQVWSVAKTCHHFAHVAVAVLSKTQIWCLRSEAMFMKLCHDGFFETHLPRPVSYSYRMPNFVRLMLYLVLKTWKKEPRFAPKEAWKNMLGRRKIPAPKDGEFEVQWKLQNLSK